MMRGFVSATKAATRERKPMVAGAADGTGVNITPPGQARSKYGFGGFRAYDFDPSMALPRLTPRAYQRVTLLALVALAFIVVTGGAVRVTGSGLGCPDWPTCDESRVVAPL